MNGYGLEESLPGKNFLQQLLEAQLAVFMTSKHIYIHTYLFSNSRKELELDTHGRADAAWLGHCIYGM
jgi:hypothetical protein